jgi:hypothetical protein
MERRDVTEAIYNGRYTYIYIPEGTSGGRGA